MRNVLMAGLSLVAALFAAAADGGAPEGLKVYQADNILRNGDFKQRALNRNAPAHWCLTVDTPAEKPEHMSLYSLENGTLQFKAPVPGIQQFLDVTPVTALEYTLSFESEVEAGELECSVMSRYESYGKLWVSRQIKAGKGFERQSFTFKLDLGVCAEELGVIFRPRGKDAVVKLRNVSLNPTLLESSADAKVLFIDDAGKNIPLRGIAVADNDSAFEHFYDLKAAQYLRKYLYVSYGRVVPVYTGSRESIEKAKGMVCFGKSLVGVAEMAKVTAGGYALEAKGGSIYIGGKDDGAVQGTFALLSGIGLEFFSNLHDFIPATGEVIKLAKPTVIRNPSFAHRSTEMGILSRAPLGESCMELQESGRYIGIWVAGTHNNAVQVPPFIYFKNHPEYYALNKDGKRVADAQLQLCWSNLEVQRIATETMLKWVELCPETKIFGMLQGDGDDSAALCQCDKCRAFGASVTDRQLRFVNIVAKAVGKKYPDKLIATWAYCMTLDAPVNVVPEPNVPVYIGVCDSPWGKNGSFTETRIDAPSCTRGVSMFSNWLRTGVPLGTALYFPSTYEAVNKMRYFGERGATNLFFGFEINWTYNYWLKDNLSAYIMRKLAWNLGADVESFIDRYMAFYYGPAAPAMRQHFNLVESQKSAYAKGIGQGDLGSDNIQFVVDYETLVRGSEYLNQAEKLVQRDTGKMMFRYQKLQFFNSYFLRNKAALLQDVELERFANSLAEVLRLARGLNDKQPKYGTSYREMIWVSTGIDIGDTQPWHRSPVVQKILDDPQGMVKANKKEAYVKTEKGLKFDLIAFAGGEDVMNYQTAGISKTKCPFAKVLRRASSPKSSISAVFTLSGVPEQGAFLTLVGLDDEKPGRAAFQVLVNGESVFAGENTFGENDWSQMKIQIPAKVLKKGANTLEIKNTTPEKISAVADIYIAKDYFWGWFLIADAEINFAPGINPVMEKAPLILDDWKKARIDVFDVTKKKLTVRGGWGDGSDVYVWGESKILSDKWEDWTISVVPEEDCNLTIWLGGPYRPAEKSSKKLLPIWAEYDDLKIEGAALKNASFETLNAQMLPEGWRCVPANVVTDATAADGKTYVRACFSQPVKQIVAAKSGQPVTISVKVRRGKQSDTP